MEVWSKVNLINEREVEDFAEMERVPEVKRGQEERVEEGGCATERDLNIMCRVGMNAIVRMSGFTGQGNRTEGIVLFKFKDVDNLGLSMALTK